MYNKIIFKRKEATNSWKIHKDEAKTLIFKLVSTNPYLKKFKYNSLKIRNQKTRWGSCSSKKNLNFNYRIIYLPEELAEYLIIHEFCHLKEMNHSKKYWDLVYKLSPNHKKLQKKLKKFPIKK